MEYDSDDGMEEVVHAEILQEDDDRSLGDDDPQDQGFQLSDSGGGSPAPGSDDTDNYSSGDDLPHGHHANGKKYFPHQVYSSHDLTKKKKTTTKNVNRALTF